MIKNFLLWKNTDAGLAVLRILVSAAMLVHGWDKLAAYNELFHDFGDPIGLGSEVSYILTVFAEFFCSILLIIGLFTRVAAVSLVITMLVAVFIAHGGDEWSKKEKAALYLIPYLAILTAGPGKYSADEQLFNKPKA